MNQLIIIGNLTKEPELRTTPSGKNVVKFTVAVNEGFGEKKSVTYFEVNAWEPLSDSCYKYLYKGMKVMAMGRASVKPYVGKDGSAHGEVILTASSVEFLSRKQPEETKDEISNIDPIDFPF